MFNEFQAFRKILCVCPHCGELSRVSDLRLKTKGPATKTWLDNHDQKNKILEKKEEKFEQEEEKIREKAREKGRKEAQKVFEQAISPSFKALKYDPFDIKPILNPVDFIVFDGMNRTKSIDEIILLSKVCSNEYLCSVRNQVESAIKKEQYDWRVARINETGNICFE